MPRIKEDVVNDPEDVTPDSNSNGEKPKRVMRPRRPAPHGVTIGLTDEPTPVAEPPVPQRGPGGGTGRGRSVDPRTVKLVETLKANPDQWYQVGIFMTNQAPSEKSALGQHGFVFRHTRNDDGVTYTRYAMSPSVTPEASPEA